jgi:putative ABC transport system permease protein
MSFWSQTWAVTALNLRNVPQRFAASTVVVLGVAGTVGVLVSVMAMANGMASAFEEAGDATRAIVLHDSVMSEEISNIDIAWAPMISDAPGVWHALDGRSAASPDLLTVVDMNTNSDSNGGRISLRGVGEAAFLVHPEWRIVAGRTFRSGLREIVIGRAAASEFGQLHIGEVVHIADTEWTVVGEFSSGGNVHESEALADVNTVMSAFARGSYSSVSVRLISPASFGKFSAALESNPSIKVNPMRERDYYRQESKHIPGLLFVVSNLIGGIMALGAMLTALNTMYSAVASRRSEIATLRAIGFGGASVVISVLAEAIVLSAVGAALGSAVTWLVFNGDTVSLTGGAFQSRLAFKLRVEPHLVAIGMIWACGIGLLGGLPPAIRAGRMPVALALRPV